MRPESAFDPTPWRSETDAVVAGRIHLNNAGASLMPRPVYDVVREHLRREVMQGGYEAADAMAAEIEQAHADVGALIGAGGRNIAVVENATVAFAQALSAFDFASDDIILTSRNDYSSNQLMYLSLAARRGVRVLRAADLPAGGVDPQSVAELMEQQRPRLVALTHVPTNSGLVQAVEEVGALCAEHEVPYIVDACQSVGQLPVDVERVQCTYLAGTARKFLRGPRGVGFLYVSDAALGAGHYPLYLDMQGAHWSDADRFELVEDATRFENWEFAYALMLGQGAAAAYAQRVGVEAGGTYAAVLAQRARDGLAAIDGVRVLDEGERLCAIATAAIDAHDAHSIVQTLREEAINTSALDRTSAVIDMDAKRTSTALRISPHYYNTTREIDLVMDAIESIVAGS